MIWARSIKIAYKMPVNNHVLRYKQIIKFVRRSHGYVKTKATAAFARSCVSYGTGINLIISK